MGQSLRLISHAFSSSVPLGYLVFSERYSTLPLRLSVLVGKLYLLGLQKVCICFSSFCSSGFWLAFREEQGFEEHLLLFPSPLSPVCLEASGGTRASPDSPDSVQCVSIGTDLYLQLQKLNTGEWKYPGSMGSLVR